MNVDVINSVALTSIFGEWPSFHDSEVLNVILSHKGSPSPSLEVHVVLWKIHPEVTESGHFRMSDFNVVELKFHGVENLEIQDLYVQNVLFDLLINRQKESEFSVVFEATLGFFAAFTCKLIEVVRVRTPVEGEWHFWK